MSDQMKFGNQRERYFKGYRTEFVVAFIISLFLAIAAFIFRTIPSIPPPEQDLIDIFLFIIDLMLAVMLVLNKKIDDVRELIPSLTMIHPPLQNRVARDFVSRRLDMILRLCEQLITYKSYSLEKTEMYKALTDLTHTMDSRQGDEIVAVSSINIGDWEGPYAQMYLDANTEAVTRGTLIRRLFLLDREDITGVDRRRFLRVIENNDRALETQRGTHVNPNRSGVKWFYKNEVAREARDLDIAIFGNAVLVMQQLGGRYELTTREDEVRRNAKLFHSLWNDRNVKSVDDLRSIMRGRS